MIIIFVIVRKNICELFLKYLELLYFGIFYIYNDTKGFKESENIELQMQVCNSSMEYYILEYFIYAMIPEVLKKVRGK